MYYHKRDVDPRWQEELERIAPRSDQVSWLKFGWLPGMPYETVQRWGVWEMVPVLEHIDPDLLADLQGVSPRVDGFWQEDPSITSQSPLVKKSARGIPLRWFSNSTVSLEQWDLYQETGCYAVLFWIVQGDKGGHLYRLSQAEIGVLEANGISGADTPAPGDLPYSGINALTIAQLAEADKLRKWDYNLKWTDRAATQNSAGLWVRSERIEQEIEYNKRMLKWLENQIENAFQDLSRVNLPAVTDDEVTKARRVDEDAIDEAFVMDTPTKVNA